MPADAKGLAFAALRRRLPPSVLLWKIENAAGPGLPDVYGVGHGTSFWVELKVGKLGEGIRVPSEKLRPAQLATLMRLSRAGVPCYIGVYAKGRLFVAKFSNALWVALGTPAGAFALETKLPGEAP